MNNISWLESIVLMTDHDPAIDMVIKKQSAEIQKAYQCNDQAALNVLFGASDRLASKINIFQL